MTRPSISRRWLVGLWAVSLALRVAFVVLEPETRPVADETMWLMATSRIPAAHFSPFSNYPIFHPPLYPYFLAALNGLFGGVFAIKLAQAFISSLLVPAVFRIAARFSGNRAAIAAGLVVGLYPELIWYSAHIWCETLFLTLLWWAIERLLAADETGSMRAGALAGLLFGLAVLTRETVLYLLPLAVLWLAAPSRTPGRRAVAVATFIAAFAVIAPWTVRNWIQFGAFIPVSTGGGLNLYQGNAQISRNEVYDEYYANEGKVEQFQWARAEGLKAILKRQPTWLFEKIRDEGPRLAELDSLALIHIRRGAYGAPTCRGYQGVAALILVPWILLAVGAALALSRIRLTRESVFLVVFVGAYLLLHIATHGFSRYRIPVLPALMILGASLADLQGSLLRPSARRPLLVLLLVALVLLWSPSLLDQLGDLGFGSPPAYEGFAPVCPA